MTASADRPALLRARLEAAFHPTALEIVDDSQRHAGHASAGGAGHFNVTIVAEAFDGKGLVERHRMVYAAVTDLIPEHIHALSIRAHTPAEKAG